jgi:hypothetical protein
MSREETGKQGGRGNKKGPDVIRTFSGTDPSYLAARIVRDHPDILDQMKAGEEESP